MGRKLNGLAFGTGVLGLGLLVVWLSLAPLQLLQMAMSARHVEGRGLLSIAPQAIAVIVIMFAAPAAVRRFQAGKFRPAWTLLLATYALVVGLAAPGQWLVWKLLADF